MGHALELLGALRDLAMPDKGDDEPCAFPDLPSFTSGHCLFVLGSGSLAKVGRGGREVDQGLGQDWPEGPPF